MLKYRAEWSVCVLERSQPSVISLEEVRKKKDSQNNILQQLLDREKNLKIKIFVIRNKDDKTFPAFETLGSFMQGNYNEDLNTNTDRLGDSAQMDAVDGRVKIDYADLARDEPDGENDDDDLVSIKRGQLVSCSTINYLMDERMMDIVGTAK